MDSFCLIEGQCVEDGAENPDNACQACSSAASANQWSTAKAVGESCGFCRECSTNVQCEKADDCCDVAEHPHNSFECGFHVTKETLVEDGCGAGESSVVRSEVASVTSSTGYICSAGTWNFSGHGESSTHGDYSPLATVSLSFSDDGKCAQAPELSERTCSSFCRFGDLPMEIRSGACDTLTLNRGVESGTVAGVRMCEQGEDRCQELTVTCQGNGWRAPMTASVSAPPAAEAPLTDVWFVREGDEERELRRVGCEVRSCQQIDLPLSHLDGYCGSVPSANWSVEIGDEVRRYYRSQTAGSAASTGIAGTVSTGFGPTYQCQSDGSWIQTGDPTSGGNSCTECEIEFTDRWYTNGAVVHDNTCNTSCRRSSATLYDYMGLPGLGSVAPQGSSYSRCVYEAGVLVSADIAVCSTEVVNEWTEYGEDSSCPNTVQDLNEWAFGNEEVSPCNSDNCVFWKSGRGRLSKATDIPD